MTSRRRTKPMETSEQKVGQDTPLEISTTGDAEIEKPDIQIIDGPDFGKKEKALIFLEEPVSIMVHESTDPNDEPVPFVGVNGRNQFFVRGKIQTVKRKFVEALARAKRTRYRTQILKNEGNVRQKLVPATALRYPFSVMEDVNPNGGAWLKKVLAEV